MRAHPTLLLACMLLAGCRDAPPVGERADDALADTREAVPGARWALPVGSGEGAWIAAARDAGATRPDPVDAAANVSRYAYEVVLVRRREQGGWEQRAPGLYVLDEADFVRRAEVDGKPAPPDVAASVALERLWGVADADGDGAPEVWTAQMYSGATDFLLDLRAYSPRTGQLYRLVVPSGESAARPDSTAREYSFNVMQMPAVQRWLAARADTVARIWNEAQGAAP